MEVTNYLSKKTPRGVLLFLIFFHMFHLNVHKLGA